MPDALDCSPPENRLRAIRKLILTHRCIHPAQLALRILQLRSYWIETFATDSFIPGLGKQEWESSGILLICHSAKQGEAVRSGQDIERFVVKLTMVCQKTDRDGRLRTRLAPCSLDDVLRYLKQRPPLVPIAPVTPIVGLP